MAACISFDRQKFNMLIDRLEHEKIMLKIELDEMNHQLLVLENRISALMMRYKND